MVVVRSVTQWAQITVERWEEKITQLNIGDSNALINSFTNEVITGSNGDPELIKFTFEYYGRMVDMGVGRGVKASDRGSVDTRRQPKPWYNKTFAREMHKLAESLAKTYGMKAVTLITTEINNES